MLGRCSPRAEMKGNSRNLGRRRSSGGRRSATRGGGALELLRRRKAAGYVHLGARMLVVSAACSGRTPSRRIGGENGRRRWTPVAWSGSAGAARAAATSRAAFGAQPHLK
jgi:hypothetical protein